MIRLALRVRRQDAELVLAELLELAPGGVEEVDAGEGVVEYAVYGVPGELPALPDLRAAAGDAFVEVSTSELPDDWSERWREFHRPVLVVPPASARGVPALLVRPSWDRADPGVEGLEIVIDPGQAFGTGAHATTQLCLELMLALCADRGAGGPLLDVGCGSGVLAIAAARLGFSPVLAVDNDPDSVRATAENAAVNHVALDVRRLDLRTELLPAAPVVVANLLRPLLLELASALADAGGGGERGAAPDHLIAGGLLEHEADEVSGAFGRHAGLLERDRRSAEGWSALWLARP